MSTASANVPVVPVPAVDLRGLSKTFGATRALHGVSLQVAQGQVHGLIGLNGSGKSTLVKMLSGYLTPDAGSALLWGEEFRLPLALPERHGVAVVQQDLALNRDLSVLDNVNVGQVLGEVGRAGRLRRGREAAAVVSLLDELGSDVDPRSIVGSLSAGEQAIVSIARALASLRSAPRDRSCLVLDEPTAYLTAADTERLFAATRRLVSAGGSAIIISHRLDDIIDLCAAVTVLREGRVVESGPVDAHTKTSLTRAMAGEVSTLLGRRPDASVTASASSAAGARSASEPAARLELRALTSARLRGVDLTLRPGEVLACTGLLGSGIGQLAHIVAGLEKPLSGELLVDGTTVRAGVRHAQERGVRLIPEDRLGRALWAAGSVGENLTIGDARLSRAGGAFVSPRRARAAASKLIEEYAVVTRGPATSIAQLSGGNQQKLVIARALAVPDLTVLVLHEPTSGVDVHARANIYEMISARTRDGIGVLLCSSDIEEVVALADRVVVLDRGQIVGELTGADLTAERIALMCQRAVPDHAKAGALAGHDPAESM